MEPYDDDLSRFEADGAAPLPATPDHSYSAMLAFLGKVL